MRGHSPQKTKKWIQRPLHKYEEYIIYHEERREPTTLLISYNNKPVSEAVPFFEEFFAPFFTYAAARGDPNRKGASDVIPVCVELAKVAARGEVPPDDLLSKASKLIIPSVLDFDKAGGLSIPTALRDAITAAIAPARDVMMSNSEVIPITTEVLDAINQIPMLIEEVADGARDFMPPPQEVNTAARRAYRARSTLLIQYKDDPFDESEDVEELLKAAGQVIRMKRPMVETDVKRITLEGWHAAPLIAPPPELANEAETILGVDAAKEQLLYKQADETVEELARWLEELNV